MKRVIAIACVLILFSSNISLMAFATEISLPVKTVNRYYTNISESHKNLALQIFRFSGVTRGLSGQLKKNLPDMFANVPSPYFLDGY